MMDTPTIKICATCKDSKAISEYSTYIDCRNGKQRVRNDCKVCRVNKETERNKQNKQKHNEHNQKYKSKNKEKIKEYERKRHAVKRVEDPHFRLRTNMGSSIRHALVDYKDDTCNTLIGCSVRLLKVWIEHQFTDGLTWNNCTEWHVDHVIPLSFFNLTDRAEQLLACNWTNLRPLIAHENLSKSNKILEDVILKHVETIKHFLSLNSGYQTDLETGWWQRIELWYGKNPKNSENFDEFLQRIIRSVDP